MSTFSVSGHRWVIPHINAVALAVLCLTFATSRGQDSPAKPIISLYDFVRAAERDFRADRQSFMKLIANLQDGCKTINPKYPAKRLNGSIDILIPKSPCLHISNKLVIGEDIEIKGLVLNSIVICKGNLIVRNGIWSSVLIVDGKMDAHTVPGILDSMIIARSSCCLDRAILSQSTLLCQGSTNVANLADSAVFSDVITADLGIDCLVFDQAVLQLPRRVSVLGRFDEAAVSGIVEFYSDDTFPIRLSNDKGAFHVKSLAKNSIYHKARMEVGDQIISIDNMAAFQSKAAILDLLGFPTPKKNSFVTIMRDGFRHYLIVR
jgi:hypothetical protein